MENEVCKSRPTFIIFRVKKINRFICFLLVLQVFAPRVCAQESDTIPFRIIPLGSNKEEDADNLGDKVKKLFIKKKRSPNTGDLEARDYILHEGKVIRNIIISTHDPFGYSLKDTLKQPSKWIERAGNDIHAKTKRFVVRELLLFKQGDRYDSLKISESERLVRANQSIRRVEIKGKNVAKDSVDLYVNAIDSWSMIFTGSVSSSRVGARIRERNFLGLGHTFDNRYRHNFERGKSLYQFNYTVPNIAKTRIRANVNYYKNEDEHYNKSISLDRPFYSPLAKYAGGITVGQRYYQDSLDFVREPTIQNNFKYDYQDFWLAKAFRINNYWNKEITNLVVSGRYYKRSFKETPSPEIDSIRFFSNQENYFLGIGLSSRHYVKRKFIFNYDIDEDIEVGKAFGLITALQRKNQKDRYYLGAKGSIGGFLSTGYLGVEAQFGGFLNKNRLEQQTLSIKTLYFSNLIAVGQWKMRNFVNMNYLYGYNRLHSPADLLSLHQSDYLGIDGFGDNREVLGTQKLMMEYQLQTYSPYEFLGFRMAPFFNASFGVLGDSKKFVLNQETPVFSRFSLGVMLSNDYFVFKNIQLSISFYPSIPGRENNAIKTNVFDNNDFKLMDFDFSKPNYIRWNRWD